jgi:hypothetical protein
MKFHDNTQLLYSKAYGKIMEIVLELYIVIEVVWVLNNSSTSLAVIGLK